MNEQPEEATVNARAGEWWKKANTVIAGGNTTHAKHPETHLDMAADMAPVSLTWPTYAEQTDGCRIRDVDGNWWIDMALMGAGANLLGYNHPKIDEAAVKAIKQGVNSTFNHVEDIALAEKLIELHPWSEKALFMRNGSEACAAAIRLARAATGRDQVIVCGFHGWHDFYLAGNMEHPQDGLPAAGVPTKLARTTHKVEYGERQNTEQLLATKQIGAVMLDIRGNDQPDKNYLDWLKRVTNKHGTVLIFDETTSGFRKTTGGLHLSSGVSPDLVVLGKALGNGYPISAVLGINSIMDEKQNTFITSTTWSERIGVACAIAVLHVMEETKAPEQVEAIGQHVKSGWEQIGRDHGLELETKGIGALPRFTVTGWNEHELQQQITTKLLKHEILGRLSFYASCAHTPELVNNYMEKLDLIVGELAEKHPMNAS